MFLLWPCRNSLLTEHNTNFYKDVNMCKIVCELCVNCNYNMGHTVPCKDFDPHLEAKENMTKHMNETMDTSTNEILFILCRTCSATTDADSMTKLDSIHAGFIGDMLDSVAKENDARTIVITGKDGHIVQIMESN